MACLYTLDLAMPRHRLFLLKELVRRDFQGRYAGSVLGFVWSFVQPLWLLLLFTFVFSTVLEISLYGERTDNFGIFLFAGLLPWMAIQETVTRGSTAITDNAALVKKLAFPSEILVLGVSLSALLHEGIALLVFAAVLLVAGELAWAGLPLLLLAVPLQLALSLGLGLLLAGANVFFRDVAQLIGMAMTGWFYFTPIVYPLSLVPGELRWLVELNPLTALVGLYREALLGDALSVPGETLFLALCAFILLVAGWWLFRRLAPEFGDQV